MNKLFIGLLLIPTVSYSESLSIYDCSIPGEPVISYKNATNCSDDCILTNKRIRFAINENKSFVKYVIEVDNKKITSGTFKPCDIINTNEWTCGEGMKAMAHYVMERRQDFYNGVFTDTWIQTVPDPDKDKTLKDPSQIPPLNRCAK